MRRLRQAVIANMVLEVWWTCWGGERQLNRDASSALDEGVHLKRNSLLHGISGQM